MIYLDEFDQDDLVYFSDRDGIAVNLEEKRMILFQKSVHGFSSVKMPIDDLVSAQVSVVTPGRHIAGHSGRVGVSGAAEALGGGLGAARLNSKAKADARKATGIELRIRSIDNPKRFLQIADERERNSVAEALRQILEEGRMPEPYRLIPGIVRVKHRRPTEGDIEREKALSLTPRDYAIAVGIIVIGFLPLAIIFEEAMASYRGSFFALGDGGSIIFGAVWIALVFIIIKMVKRVRFAMRS